MSGRVLSFKSYIGGADNVQMLEMFPSTQSQFTYNYGFNVSSYQFDADFQTIVVDTLTYDRVSGDPNFTDANIVGSFGSNTTIGAVLSIPVMPQMVTSNSQYHHKGIQETLYQMPEQMYQLL